MGSLIDSTWNFSESSDYEFDTSLIEVINGKAQLKPLDHHDSGEDFNHGSASETSLKEGLSLGIDTRSLNSDDLRVDSILNTKNSSLIGYWRFDGNYNDSSGQENHGVPISGQALSSSTYKIGTESAEFFGSSYVDLPDDIIEGRSKATVALWFRTSDMSVGHRMIFSARGLSNKRFYIFQSGAELSFSALDTNPFQSILITDNTWYHAALVLRDDQSAEAYLNGVSIGEVTGLVNETVGHLLSIGSYNDGAGNLWNGSIDEVSLWSESLSSEEINTLYQAQSLIYNDLSADWTPKWNNMVGYWKMDGNWQDSSGGEKTGVANGGPQFTDNRKVGLLAAEFLSDGDSVSIPHHTDFNFTEQLSISSWVYLKHYSSSYAHHIISKFSTSVTDNFSLYLFGHHAGANLSDQGRVRLFATDGGVHSLKSASYSLRLGRWYHVAATYDHVKGGLLYIDGQRVGGYVSSGPLVNNTADIQINKNSGGIGDSGLIIDEVGLWGAELTHAEVLNIYNRQKQKYAGQYDSEVIDLGSTTSVWPDLSWSTSLPFGKELVGDFNNDGNPDSESSSDYSLLSGDLSNELVAYWRFDSPSWTLNTVDQLVDETGNGHHATPRKTGLESQQGILGRAASSETSGSYFRISAANAPALTANMSVSGWFRATSDTSSSAPLFWKYVSVVGGVFISKNASSNNLWLYTRTPQGFASTFSSRDVFDGNWYHFVATWNGTSHALYINGQLDVSDTFSATFGSDPGTDMFLGPSHASQTFNGALDDYAIWSRTLTPNEIQQLYRRGANRIKLQVKSCLDLSCNCKSYGTGGTETDCDGDGTFNTTDTDDIHKSEFIGPGGDGTTYYSELYNRTSAEVTFNCALNITDGDAGVCAPDEITLTAGPRPTGPEFLNIDYAQFVTPPANRYAQYRVYMEAVDNTACNGEPCLPELKSVSFNPTGLTRYVGANTLVKPKSSINFKKLLSAEIIADACASFRLSRSNTEYYYDGTSWVPATIDAHRNPASVVESNITTFANDHGTGFLKVNAYLSSGVNQSSPCTINSIDIKYE